MSMGEMVAAAVALLVAAIPGFYKWQRDREAARQKAEADHQQEIKDAEARAYAKARLEAIAREAEAALAAKNRELEELRAEHAKCLGEADA